MKYLFTVKRVLVISVLVMISACTHKVQVETKEPITININVKIDHEIKVKVDKELDDIFSEDSDLF